MQNRLGGGLLRRFGLDRVSNVNINDFTVSERKISLSEFK